MNFVTQSFKNSSRVRKEVLLFCIAMLGSLLLSCWIAIQESVINTDAICYLISADVIGVNGFNAATHACDQAKWPFYSVLIYAVSHFTHLSPIASAYCINALFSMLSVIFFLLIVKSLNGNLRTLSLAVITILLSHTFNNIREYIIRDHGFWAFYLASLYFLLNYFQKRQAVSAIAWGISLLIATLFRIEGAIFLLLIPTVIWFNIDMSWRDRARGFLLLHLPTLVICGVVSVGLAYYSHQPMTKLSRIAELLQQFQHGFILLIERYHATELALSQHVLSADSLADTGLVTKVFYGGWYIVRVFANLSWIYALLFIYALLRRCLPLHLSSRVILYAYIAINVVITFAFLLEHLFLSKRYLIALTLTMMLWIPFALDKLFATFPLNVKAHKNKRATPNESAMPIVQRGLKIIVVLGMFISALGGIFDFGYSKAYIHNAGNWVARNVPIDAALYANDLQFMYYSHHYGQQIFQTFDEQSKMTNIANIRLKAYDYLALRLDKKSAREPLPFLRKGLILPLHTFSNRRGDKVVIYKVTHEENVS